MSFVSSSIVEVVMNKIALQIVSVQIVEYSNETNIDVRMYTWRIYFYVDVVTLLYTFNEMLKGIYTGLYTNVCIDWRIYMRMTLRCIEVNTIGWESSWTILDTLEYRITIVWETVTLRSRCVKCHSDVCFAPSTL